MTVLAPVIDYLDFATKRIYLLPGVTTYHPVEDIYNEVRNLRRIDESLRGMDPQVTASGAVPTSEGKFTPRRAIFNNGWRVRPEDVNSEIFVTGEQITDVGTSGSACIDTDGMTARVIINYEPPRSEVIRDEKSLAAIRHMAFNNAVTYDAVNGYPGTGTSPIGDDIGTPRSPASNITDAGLIAKREGFKTGIVLSDLTIGNETSIENFHLIGEGATRTTITILPEALAENVYVEEAHILGTLDGNVRLSKCLITDLNYVNGYIDNCILSQGKIVLGGGHIASITNCAAGVGTPEVDFGGSGQGLILQKYSGPIKISNKTGVEAVVIGLDSGIVSIDMLTVVNGTVVASGNGIMVDSNTSEEIVSGTYGDLEVINLLNGNESVARATWNHSDGMDIKNSISFIKDIEGGKWIIENNQMIFFKDDNTTEIARFNLFDKNGNLSEESIFKRERL